MDLEERIQREEGLESVSETQVIRYWLREELDEADDGPLDADAVESQPGLREELLERKPIASRTFGAEPSDWYHVDLSEEELRDLRVVVGPHDEDWRALAEDNRVGAIAERIYEVETDETTNVAELDAETPKDVSEVVELADAIDPEGPVSRLVVAKEGDDPAYVVDGNHRAVAHVLYLLRGGEFTGQEAYLGIQG
ncbi:hypothetical protein BRD15_12545 [Halobacteriales archaeon SW_6_65_15]|jgi:hypothetical protein|nr:MAG: hypothetical protein BRD15_12545 [Halobacteriales archaeon SW_6_65_15]